MAEYGEWNRKGATLSDVTAQREFGVSRDFIVKGIRAGKLEYREGVVWGIAGRSGADRLSREKTRQSYAGVKKEIAALKKRLGELETRKAELETARRR